MQFSRHINITGGALRRWFIAQCYNSAAVGALWWLGLDYLHVPWAPFWAILAALLQFIPHFGPVMAVMGPAMVALFAGGFEQFLYVIILYGGIVVVDGLLLQPVIMRRTARVPIWASLIVPHAVEPGLRLLGIAAGGSAAGGDLRLSAHMGSGDAAMVPRQTPPGQAITGGRLISPGAAARAAFRRRINSSKPNRGFARMNTDLLRGLRTGGISQLLPSQDKPVPRLLSARFGRPATNRSRRTPTRRETISSGSGSFDSSLRSSLRIHPVGGAEFRPSFSTSSSGCGHRIRRIE